MNRGRRALLLAGLVAGIALGSAKGADDVSDFGESTMIGKLSPDAKLHPAIPAGHPLTTGGAGTNQLVIYFVALVGLVAVGYVVLKRGLPLRTARGSENRLHLRETKMLGNRQFLVVAEYEGSRMLLGVGPGKIEYLCPLDGGDEPENPAGTPRSTP